VDKTQILEASKHTERHGADRQNQSAVGGEEERCDIAIGSVSCIGIRRNGCAPDFTAAAHQRESGNPHDEEASRPQTHRSMHIMVQSAGPRRGQREHAAGAQASRSLGRESAHAVRHEHARDATHPDGCDSSPFATARGNSKTPSQKPQRSRWAKKDSNLQPTD
jgi:hypothetical protein